MNSREEKDRASHSHSPEELETPFLEEEFFVGEAKAEWEARLAMLETESPFRQAFEQSRTSFIEPEKLEEEFVKEEERDDAYDFPVEETEAYDEEVPADLKDSREEFGEDGKALYTDAEIEDEEGSYLEDIRSLEEETLIPKKDWIELDEEVAYPPEESEYEEEEPALDEEFFIAGLSRFLSPGAIIQRVQKLLSEGAFNLSLLDRFASGQIWNEDHLALEILFHRQPKLRPTGLNKLFSLQRLRLLRSLAVKHQRELRAIREHIVRPIFGNPGNFQIGSVEGCQIQDLREEVRILGPLPGGKNKRGETWYKRNARRSPRKRADVDSIVLHHMAYNIGNDVNLYKKVGAHYIVTADGQVAQLYDDLDFLNASNNFNRRCVSIEFAGNFPDIFYKWWKPRDRKIPDRCYLTPTQIRAGRCLLATLKDRLPDIKYLYAHRQSSKSRVNDPGSDVWYNIAEWALGNLNLTDRLPKTHEGTGQPIPDNWRTSRPAMPEMRVAPAPQSTSGEQEATYSEEEEEEEAFPGDITSLEEETLEEPFLDELDEEDEYEYLFLETESPPSIRVTKRSRPVPELDPVPFASTPPRGSYWPIVTSIPQGREVTFLAVDNKGMGSRYGTRGRQFLAERSGGRYHVGVDLFANFNDPVVACQDGKIEGFYSFCCGDKKTSWALLVDHGNVVVNYGEVAPDSLGRAGGLRTGSQVRAGQLIGFIGRNPGGSSMLHFETYTLGTKRNKRWKVNEKRPPELLNPTEYLLFLAEFGLVGSVPITTPAATPTRHPTPGAAKPTDELVRFAQRMLNAAEGERLAVDGDLGPLTRGALERFRKNYNLGAGDVLDEKTQLALAQRALEEIRQQSLFAQPGVLDAATREALFSFKSEHGLGTDATLDASTRTALADALGAATMPTRQPTPGATAAKVSKSGGKWGGWRGRQTTSTTFITPSYIRDKYDLAVAVAAKVEGAFDKAQMYDKGILSWGIKQWTLHRGSLQKVLGFIKNQLDKSGQRSLWTELFPGIDIQGNRIIINGAAYSVPKKDNDEADRVLRKVFRGTERPEDFDKDIMDHWLDVFALAGRHPNIRKLQFEYTVMSLKKNLNKNLGEVLKARKDIKESEVNNYRRVGDYVESSSVAIALFNGMETQNPQWTYRYLKRIVDRFSKKYGTYHTSQWPFGWQEQFAEELKKEFQESGVACWGTKALETKPACKGRTSRTEKILRAYKELSRYLESEK